VLEDINVQKNVFGFILEIVSLKNYLIFSLKKCSKNAQKSLLIKKFKECVTGCIHIVKTKQCWDKCVKHRIDKEHSKCERVLVRKGKKFKKCSIKDIGKICHKQCKHFPAICKQVCKDKHCGHSKCHCCRIKCTKRPDVCHKWCVEKKNIKNVSLFQFLQNIEIIVGNFSLIDLLINVLKNVLFLNLFLHGQKYLLLQKIKLN